MSGEVVTPSRNGWLKPSCESRTGAAHQRRGAPCQDASGLWSFVDGGGEPVQVLVVSDGHGGARYDRSEVGSRLACQVALEEIQSQLAKASLSRSADSDEWRQWLAVSLPETILKRWRFEVLQHAQAYQRVEGNAAATLPYGATLGVLLLTTHWWGYTGLGDWDLVRLDSEGKGTLLSEEPDQPGGGEATFSLCMQGAERYFASRSGLVSISRGEAPFSLLLSSDGIRKSCGSDADFLTLARHLCTLPGSRADGEGSGLAEALDHISSQGSGDDVSVAIGRWGVCDESPQQQGKWRTVRPVIVQPIHDPGGQAASTLVLAERPLLEAPGERMAPSDGTEQHDPDEKKRARSRPWPLLVFVLVALALAGAATLAARQIGWGPFAGRDKGTKEVDQERGAAIAGEVVRLCEPHRTVAASERPGRSGEPNGIPTRDGATFNDGQLGAEALAGNARPAKTRGSRTGLRSGLNAELLERIHDSLDQRRSTFQRILKQTTYGDELLLDPSQDPRGALIAWSRLHPGLKHAAESLRTDPGHGQSLKSWISAWVRPDTAKAHPEQREVICPELQQALSQQWLRAKSEAHLSAAGPKEREKIDEGQPLPPGRDSAGTSSPASPAQEGGQLHESAGSPNR